MGYTGHGMVTSAELGQWSVVGPGQVSGQCYQSQLTGEIERRKYISDQTHPIIVRLI